MEPPDLSHTTLVCADCYDIKRVLDVIDKCEAICKFGAIKLLTSIPTDYRHALKIAPLNSINDYSAFCLKELYKFIDTPYMLIVQHDGWVINPEAWDEKWTQYGYIGPLYLQEDRVTDHAVGSGGFSFRSRALMKDVADLLPPRDGNFSYNAKDGKDHWSHEDGVITHYLRHQLMTRGHKFAPPIEAAKFAYGGNKNPNYRFPKPFGFHGFYAIDMLRGGPGNGARVYP